MTVRAESRGAWIGRLPRGIPLPEAEWRSRHRLILAVLGMQVPALIGFAQYLNSPLTVTLSECGFIAGCFVVAALPGPRMRQSLAATVGLVSCSAVLGALSQGANLSHFHFFLTTTLVALYQDWRPFATAFVAVPVEHMLVRLYGSGAYVTPPGSIRDAALQAASHGAFVAAAGAVLMVFWGFSERSYAREESYRMQLLDAEMGAIARLREAGQMREDLIASVSHEFRTPLTAIHGVVATLRRQGDRIAPEVRDSLLAGIEEHGMRLARLLEDMLAAASARVSDPTAVADVYSAVVAAGDEFGVLATAPPGLVAAVAPETLDQLLGALLRHGIDHTRAGRPVQLEGVADGNEALLLLRYTSDAATAECPKRLLEPFASRESAETGRPTSLDLYLARRLAEVNDGRVHATVDEGNAVTVTVRLRGLREIREESAADRAGLPEAVHTS